MASYFGYLYGFWGSDDAIFACGCEGSGYNHHKSCEVFKLQTMAYVCAKQLAFFILVHHSLTSFIALSCLDFISMATPSTGLFSFPKWTGFFQLEDSTTKLMIVSSSWVKRLWFEVVLPQMLTHRYEHGCVTHQGKVYVVGGFRDK